MPLKKQQYFLPVIDLLIFAAAWILAYTLRFGLAVPAVEDPYEANNYASQLIQLLPWVVLTHGALYFGFQLYKGILRYAGETELKSMAIAGGIHLAFWLLFNAFIETRETLGTLPCGVDSDGDLYVMRVPYIIIVLYGLLSNGVAGAVRFIPRLLSDRGGRADAGQPPAALIVGAGDLADSVLRRESPDFRPICAVAESVNRVGLRLHGIPVVGTVDKIAKVIGENKIELVLIALDESTPERLRRVVDACGEAEVAFRIVPSLKDISDGRVEVSAVRMVEIEDLLGRKTVKLEISAERNYLRGETILITGAGGSIGSEIARQAATAGAGKLLLLGRGENSIFEITEEIGRHFPDIEVVPLIVDIRDTTRLDRIFSEYRPAIVFHAAAHKHVPLMETIPDEAVKNNVLGTANVARLADSYGARRFVLISSDKAVRPVSVMGATKRLSEMVVFSIARNSSCRFVAVRFGNVMGSRGSVIPVFRRQILEGGPVRVTHADAKRYFMTIPEAVSLVLQAGTREENGRLYILDMGEQIRIADLARNMITLSGLRPDVDIRIEYTGLRPGEKMEEELTSLREKARETEIEKLLEAQAPPPVDWEEMVDVLQMMEELCWSGRRTELVAFMKGLIGDYDPAGWQVADAELPARMVVPEFPEAEPTLLDSLDEPVEEASTEPDQEAAAEEIKAGPVIIEPDMFEEADKDGGADAAECPAVENEEEAPETAPGEEPGAETEEVSFLDDLLPDDADEGGFEENLDQLEEETADLAAEDGELAEALEDLGNDLFADSEVEKEEEIGVESPSVQTHDSAPAGGKSENPPVDPEDRDEKMAELPRMKSKDCLLVMRVTPGIDVATLEMLLKQLTGKVLRDGDKLLCLVDSETAGLIPEGIAKIEKAGRKEGDVMAEALVQAPADGMLMTLTSEVLLGERALDTFAKVLMEGAPLVYSDFEEDRGGIKETVQPHDHEGCPHERFEYGMVICYSVPAIKAVGGVRKDLSYAWEYDLHLKLMEMAPFRAIHETLYTHFIPTAPEGSGSSVYSPGKGPLGGFSYVFYPEDMEKEVTGVFEEAMKRRGVWIDHPTVEVNHEGRTYEVKASIVIPILNRVKYIANAIEKVQQGTFPDFEMLIVDNGSTDGTIDVVKNIAAKDPRIRLLHGKGSTIASALNEGIRAARGKYICQLDSDDEYHPTCLEKMIGHFESHPKCGLAISYYRLMDEKGRVLEAIPPVTHGGYSRNQVLRRDGAGAVRIFPKAVLEEFGLYDEVHYGNFGEDYDMVLKVGEKYDVDRVHEVLYHYRRHSDNTDVTRDPVMKYKNKNRSRQEALRRRLAINKKLGKA